MGVYLAAGRWREVRAGAVDEVAGQVISQK